VQQAVDAVAQVQVVHVRGGGAQVRDQQADLPLRKLAREEERIEPQVQRRRLDGALRQLAQLVGVAAGQLRLFQGLVHAQSGVGAAPMPLIIPARLPVSSTRHSPSARLTGATCTWSICIPSPSVIRIR
jgi:hypothetical protein